MPGGAAPVPGRPAYVLLLLLSTFHSAAAVDFPPVRLAPRRGIGGRGKFHPAAIRPGTNRAFAAVSTLAAFHKIGHQSSVNSWLHILQQQSIRVSGESIRLGPNGVLYQRR